MNLKILIADKLAPEGATFLRSQTGVEVIENTGLKAMNLLQLFLTSMASSYAQQ